MDPTNFPLGQIYKIVNSVDSNIYIGSTTRSLNKRFAQHRAVFKRGRDCNIYKHMLLIGFNKFKIVNLEMVVCFNDLILKERENYWIETFDSVRNGLNTYYTSISCRHNLLRIKCLFCRTTYLSLTKCSRCKQFRSNDSFEFTNSGKQLKTCLSCRQSKKSRYPKRTKSVTSCNTMDPTNYTDSFGFKMDSTKCSRCKQFRSNDSFELTNSGKQLKTCLSCRQSKKSSYQKRTKSFTIYNGKVQTGLHIVPDLGQEERVIEGNIEDFLI